MKRQVSILVVPTSDTHAHWNVAALVLSLGKLGWERWQPTLHVLSDDEFYEDALRRWWPFKGKVVRSSAPPQGPEDPHSDRIRRLQAWQKNDAEVCLVLGERIVAAAPFEDVLDDLANLDGVAGVPAYHNFTAWPGLNQQEAWRRLTDGLLNQPIAFTHSYSLAKADGAQDGSRIPFYINPEAFFVSGKCIDAFMAEWANSAAALLGRIPVPMFLEAVALTLAVARLDVPQKALPLRFNVPNDPAVALASDELNDACLLQLRRTEASGADLFASKSSYDSFIAGRHEGVDDLFRRSLARVFGREYPFDQDVAPHPREEASVASKSAHPLIHPEPKPSVTGCAHFDYSARQPNLYLLMRFKQALVAEFGIAEGFRKFQSVARAAASGTLVRKALMGERDFAQSHAVVFRETSPAGAPFRHEPPKVSGEGNHAPILGTSRSQYVACLRDVTVRGRSAIIETANAAILDFQGAELSRLDDEIDWDPAIFHCNGREAWVMTEGSEAPKGDLASAFTLVGAHTDFFGHWISEYLPKFTAAMLAGIPPGTPVLIDAHMPSSHRRSLELLFPDEFEIIELEAFQTVCVQQLWCAPTLMYMPLHEQRNAKFDWGIVATPPALFGSVVQDWTRRADAVLPTKPGFQRVFLARRSFRHRKIENAGAIEDLARAFGFAIIYPEELDFSDQIAFCRDATHIIAPEGSALFLVLFSRPGTKLCILSHPLTDALVEYNGHFSQRGIDVVALTGPFVRMANEISHDSDYTIDPAALGDLLIGWLGADTGFMPPPI